MTSPRPPFDIWVKPEDITPFFFVQHHPFALSLLLRIGGSFKVDIFHKLELEGSSKDWEILTRGRSVFSTASIIAVAFTVTINAAEKYAVNKAKESSAESTFHFGIKFRLIDGIHRWGKVVLVIKAELHDSEIVFYASSTGDSKNFR